MNDIELRHGTFQEHGAELTEKDNAALLVLQGDVMADWVKKEHKEAGAQIEWIDQYAQRARELFNSEGKRLLAMIRDGRVEEAMQEIKNRLYH